MMNSTGLALIVVAAAGISAVVILALLPLLHRFVLVHPNVRSSHHRSTPQGGGLAVIAATLAVAAGAAILGAHDQSPALTSLWMVFAATALIALVGAIDDIWTVEIAPRLLLQAVAVGIILASLPTELRAVPMLPWWFERTLLFVACLWLVNLTNFMDGIDWMTIAEFVPVTAGLAIIGSLGALPSHGTLVAVALCGGLLGFAPFNKPVARLFLGDVGSLPIGLLLSWLLILLAGNGHLAAALILPLYYLADATLTLLRRAAKGEPFWQAHRKHFYQAATDRGFSVPDIVARVFAVNLALVALAVASVIWPGALTAVATLGIGCALVGWLLYRFSQGRS